MNLQDIELFQTKDGVVSLPVKMGADTVWLSQAHMAQLFEKDRTVIGRHIRNAIKEGEVDPQVACANFAHTTQHGAMTGRSQTVAVTYYNLDVIISVGYRVKSQRGVEFRRWATSVLRAHLLQGYSINQHRLMQLGQTLEVMKRVTNELDAEQVLDVVHTYSTALMLIDGYDHQTIGKPQLQNVAVQITYKECREFIDNMSFSSTSSLFGNEKDGSFKSAIGAIYQSFDGKELYPSIQEKAANLLYFITKNHAFSDGNKRIAAGIFLYFLNRNNALFFANGRKRISDHTLVALTIMIAESKPQEKEMMINLVMTFLQE